MVKPPQHSRRSDCPIAFGLDTFGDRWTLLVLRDIVLCQKTRFSDFTVDEHIAPNILADRLNKLEKNGFIVKQRNETLRNEFIYTATEKSKNLLPALVELILWGTRYDGESTVSPEFVDRIKADRMAVAREIHDAVQQGTFVQYQQSKLETRNQTDSGKE
jgi:DNA-binding HxlR family transcriptional regulator